MHEPPSYEAIRSAAHAGDVRVAFEQWYREARGEFAPLANVPSRSFAPRFRWVPAATACPSPHAGTVAIAVDWRVLAARLDDILGMQTRRQAGALPPDAIVGLCRHWQAIERLARDGAPKGAMQGPSAVLASDEERGAISRAARTVLWAAASQHWQLLTGLARAARARAARIEARVKAARRRDWCAWLGCGTGSSPPRLTRSGYRWVKGTGGWTRSPIGDAVRNDNASVAAPHLVGDDMACERTGCWPIDLWVVLIVLLPKPDGGLRPICLFPTPVRIWMRAWAWIAQAWEAAHASPRLFGGKGMGAQRAAWTAAFQAEAAALDTMSHAVALLDLVKAFERIPHWHLVQAALRYGYPIVLLRLSPAAYRIRRAVGVAGVFRALSLQRVVSPRLRGLPPLS